MSKVIGWIVVLLFLPILLPLLLWAGLVYDWRDTVPEDNTHEN